MARKKTELKEAVATNMFDSAPVVVVKSAAAEKEAKGKIREVEIGDKLDSFAAINALAECLNTAKETYRSEIIAVMIDDFTQESMNLKKRPDSFKGVGPNSEANCQMKKRSTSSALNASEIELLKANKISYDVTTVAEEIPEQYFFNPDILSDASITAKISAKLAEIPELAGKQVIMKQAKRDKVIKNVVSESSFDEIAKLTDPVLVKQLLTVVSSLAIKDKLNTQDLNVVLDLVRKAGLVL